MKPGYQIHIPPHGHVRYVDHLGSDQRVVESARISFESSSKGEKADKKLLNYLFKSRHTSPFEQCNVTFDIKFPIFLMRQFVRHRTFRLNEVSARYTELPDEFFVPDKWRKQNVEGNKQGSHTADEDQMWHDLNSSAAVDVYDYAYQTYKGLIARGVANEQARMVLPVGIYTHICVNIDLHNMLHFLRLRAFPEHKLVRAGDEVDKNLYRRQSSPTHAQAEMADIAKAMCDIGAQLFPWTFEAANRFVWPQLDLNPEADL